jgi:hypothetical protein
LVQYIDGDIVTGMLLQEMKQVYSDGFRSYFDSLYNYMDIAVLTLYITSFTLKYLSIMKVNVFSSVLGVCFSRNNYFYFILCH